MMPHAISVCHLIQSHLAPFIYLVFASSLLLSHSFVRRLLHFRFQFNFVSACSIFHFPFSCLTVECFSDEVERGGDERGEYINFSILHLDTYIQSSSSMSIQVWIRQSFCGNEKKIPEKWFVHKSSELIRCFSLWCGRSGWAVVWINLSAPHSQSDVNNKSEEHKKKNENGRIQFPFIVWLLKVDFSFPFRLFFCFFLSLSSSILTTWKSSFAFLTFSLSSRTHHTTHTPFTYHAKRHVNLKRLVGNDDDGVYMCSTYMWILDGSSSCSLISIRCHISNVLMRDSYTI